MSISLSGSGDFDVRREYSGTLSFALSLCCHVVKFAMKIVFDSRNSHFAHFHFF